MDDRKRELSFCDIFAETLILSIGTGFDIKNIVSDLKDGSQSIGERDTVAVISLFSRPIIPKKARSLPVLTALQLHEFDCQTK